MTLQALRATVGDEPFFALAKGWAAQHAGGTVSTADFVEFAEVSTGRELDDLFDVWLYSAEKPRPNGQY
jgi:aminopeptidase N